MRRSNWPDVTDQRIPPRLSMAFSIVCGVKRPGLGRRGRGRPRIPAPIKLLPISPWKKEADLMPAGQPFTNLCEQMARPRGAGRVDLHVHTTASDGDYTPA